MNIDFSKYPDGLASAIVQDARTQKVLMLGFMNEDAFRLTRETHMVTFFSRSRNCIWVKGETSGNYLRVEDILVDCDSDTILIKAHPAGPVCHTGSETCFGEANAPNSFLHSLEKIVRSRKADQKEDSYTSKLFANGLNKIAQKVGEEAVELIIEAKDTDDEKFKSEAADLIFHLLVLFAEKNVSLDDVLETLAERAEGANANSGSTSLPA